MKRDLNKITIVGILEKDPVSKSSSFVGLHDDQGCFFKIKTRFDSSSGLFHESTISVFVMYEKAASACKRFLKSGSRVCVEGVLFSTVSNTGEVYTFVYGEKVHFAFTLFNEITFYNPQTGVTEKRSIVQDNMKRQRIQSSHDGIPEIDAHHSAPRNYENYIPQTPVRSEFTDPNKEDFKQDLSGDSGIPF